MPIAEITGLLGAANHAANAAREVFGLVKDTKTKQAVIGLQDAIIGLHEKIRSAQIEYDDLAKAKREVENQLADQKSWNAEASRYQLHDLAPGVFVYALKPECKGNEPEHYLCPTCYSKKEKSILQRPGVDHTNYVCHSCKMDIRPVATPSGFVVPRSRFRSRMLDGI